ncbi:hypothetical protein [Foetidibacter luteolus]|uniref:hypothetical protein n=1 Tax=Foetidibacter luteolus TaxID=2608880 RepID=UPI00129ADC6C|nr:hypothetical protein [Foetidibacter luteolus]
MFLIIQKANPVFSIQQQMQQAYPLLKVQFFRFPQRKQPIPADVVLKPVQSLRFYDGYTCNWKIDISKHRQVNQVEEDMQALLGPYAQLCCKQGDNWVAVKNKAYYTLGELCCEACISIKSKALRKKPVAGYAMPAR